MRVAVLLVLALGVACRQGEAPPPPPSPAAAPAPPFTDVTAAAGIDFVHENGATERRYLPETLGAGAAFADFDGDGWPDLYLVNGLAVDQLGAPPPDAPTGVLYHNRGDGTFEDVTAASGLATPFLGMGVAVGDVDGDRALDLYVTAVGGDHLFRNRGDGTFEEVSHSWGVPDAGFGSSAAFLDYERDGRLDLVAGRYVVWSSAADQRCSPDGVHRVYCTPEVYEAEPNRLLANVGGRRFADVTTAAGLGNPAGKTLGLVPLDQDGDGWPDLAVANDTSPNQLWLNQRDGTFREVGMAAGMAVAESGSPRGGMGVDAGDLDGDGCTDLVIGNFSLEMAAVYRATEGGVFVDEAARNGVGFPSLLTLAFGTLLLDQDGDGRLDILLANGHLEPRIAQFRSSQTYPQPLQLFRNQAPSGFVEVPAGSWSGPWVGRSLAAADYDRDGDLDVLLTQNGGPARLLRNESPPASWLRLRLVSRRSPTPPYGAEVIAVAGGRRIHRNLVSGRSYLSASEPVLTLGLGDLRRIERLEIRWPSGAAQTLIDVGVDREMVVEEPPGDAASEQAAESRSPRRSIRQGDESVRCSAGNDSENQKRSRG